ncbi:MazG-like family protein [Streptococcus thermophilus]|uniref:MazG-like family protein n=1 Tax=Streptococcus thermophilus TaxID=1308 RepID=UPI0022EAF25D|nr:MazG-like family protein [Streptococcus thermophilus]MDA3769186.1 MazG-like family protein [Streptococcus thermophilus]
MNIKKYKVGQQVAICGIIEEIKIEDLRDIENTTHLVIDTCTKTIDINPKYDEPITDLNHQKDDESITALISNIKDWADERDIKQADPKIQWMRITEEVGEIRDVLLKPTKFAEPQTALKDAIGDTLVTIIVLAHQLDLDVTECLNIAYNEIKNRKGKIVNGTFVKESDL